MLGDWLTGQGIEVLFLSLLLAMARPLAFVFVLPLFTRFGLQEGVIRGAILIAFSVPVFPGVVEAMAAQPASPSTPLMAVLLIKEMLIGLLLALVIGVPLWAVVAAGDIIDMQRGASMSTLVDPGSGDDTTLTGTFFFLLTALVLVSSGWFTEVVLQSLYDTYTAWPILTPLPPLDPKLGAGVLILLDTLVETGAVLAIPILGPLLLTEVAMALAGRYTQQINIMFLAMSVKQLIYILLLPVYLSGLLYYMRGEIRDLGGAMQVLEGFFVP